MAQNQLTLCYLTEKPNAIARIASILKQTYPKIIASQESTIEDMLSIKGLDLIIADASYRKIPSNVPVLYVVSSTDAESFMNDSSDFITEEEINTFALNRSVKNIIEREKLLNELKDASIKDELTGLYNQRYVTEALSKEIKKALRYNYPLTLLYLGLDGMKKVNGRFGHEVGDKVISDFCLILSNSVREVDTIGRFSGDEFIAILPETNEKNSYKVCERIQHATKNFAFANGEGGLDIGVSIGIASIISTLKTRESLIFEARSALIGAKKRGMNSVCTFEESKLIDEPVKENTELITAIKQHILLLTEETKKNYLTKILKFFEEIPLYGKMLSHAEHVTFYAARLANKMGLSEEETVVLKNSAILHDIGKLAIDDRVVLKNGPLTSTEYALIRQHPVLAAQMLSESAFMRNETNIILHHHEHYDGAGYPDHMQGTHIPLLSRIIALAESWDAMITEQPYRQALPLDQALDELKKGAGKQFDPEIVAVFTGLIEN